MAVLEDLLQEDELLSVLGLPHPKSRLGETGLFSPGGVSLMNVPFDALSFLRNTFYQQLLDLTKLTFYIYWGICR